MLQTCRLLMRLSTVSFANMACNSFLTKPQQFPKCVECWPIEVGYLSASGVQSSIARGKWRSRMQLSVIWGVNRVRKSDQHSALVTLTSYNKSLLPQDFGGSKFESNVRVGNRDRWKSKGVGEGANWPYESAGKISAADEPPWLRDRTWTARDLGQVHRLFGRRVW